MSTQWGALNAEMPERERTTKDQTGRHKLCRKRQGILGLSVDETTDTVAWRK